MDNSLAYIALLTALLPLGGALVAGLLGKCLGRNLTHTIVIACVGLAFFLSCYLFKIFVMDGHPVVDQPFYTWATAGVMHFEVAFLLDRLSITMIMIVLFISLMVHIYTVGYMAEDPATRDFSVMFHSLLFPC